MSDWVPIKSFSSRHEAEHAKALLEENNIEVLVQSSDAGGVHPMLAFTQGMRLLVRKGNIRAAKEALDVLE